MGFWIVTVALALAVTALLSIALIRGRRMGEPAAAYDLRVYRDQLAGVDRDAARGMIEEGEADRLRVEISRRILAADAQIKQAQAGSDVPTALRFGALALIAVALVAGSVFVYRGLGAPGYIDLGLEHRKDLAAKARRERPSQAVAEADLPPRPPLNQADAEYGALVERLRLAIKDRPNDLQGHILLARSEAAVGEFVAAYTAQAKVIALKGADASVNDHTYYADLLIQATGGYVSPEAEQALAAALKLDQNNGTARFYWGLMMAQTGRPDVAFRIWEELLRSSPPDAPWVPPIRAQIEEMAWRSGVEYELPPIQPLSGPSAEDIEAASALSAEEQQDMIRGMVSQLSDRLATEGGSPEEWARLIGALGVLGDTDRASAIYAEAKQTFASNPAALAAITAAAQRAGLAR